MGLTRRMGLMMMPVMRFEQAGRAMWAAAGLGPDKIDQIVRDHRLEMSKYRKGDFHSATEADLYMSQVEQSWRVAYRTTWKRVGPYFCFFFWDAACVALGIYNPPLQYVMRTGDSAWQACDVPEEIRDAMEEWLRLQQRQRMNG